MNALNHKSSGLDFACFSSSTLLILGVAFSLLSACATLENKPQEPVTQQTSSAQAQPFCPAAPHPAPAPSQTQGAALYHLAKWTDLPGWRTDNVAQAWDALQSSCQAIVTRKNMALWRSVCSAAATLGTSPNTDTVRSFLEAKLTPWQLTNADGSVEGLITGYYEPLIKGSRSASKQYPFPVYGVPDDMMTIELGSVYPELKNKRLRGRIEGHKVLPYWTREQLESKNIVPSKVLLWAEDAIDLFFMQVQGSGQVEFSDGSRIRLAYADQNGYPYKSIGRWLVSKGELKLDQASMQGIKNWVKANPKRLSELLNVNPSYVFFQEEPANTAGPNGALGIPLTQGRSIAVDTENIPLGVPVFLATTAPDGSALNRLMMAQDTGSAIKGRVRADFYWGFGAKAGAQAGRMRQQGKMWVLWPQNSSPEQDFTP